MDKNALEKKYLEEIRPAMMEHFGYKNIYQVPKIEKVVLNMGVGEGSRDIKLLESLCGDLSTIAGQKAMITRAKKSVANFKLREGMPIGCMVTLRRRKMNDFLMRLLNIAIPRIRDFRGLLSRSFDGRGNYAMGLEEQLVFPEINYDKIARIQGLNVVIVTTAQNDEEGKELLRLYGFPFRN